MYRQEDPWLRFPHIWKTKAAFFSYLRGNLRKAVWNRWVGKTTLKNSVCTPPPQGVDTRAKTGAYCSLTGEWVGKSKLEVDHIEGGAKLNDWEDLEGFVQHLCCPVEDLQVVSKEAHKIKSYAERMGLTFEEAKEAKKLIAFKKLSKLDKLDELGYTSQHTATHEALNVEWLSKQAN